MEDWPLVSPGEPLNLSSHAWNAMMLINRVAHQNRLGDSGVGGSTSSLTSAVQILLRNDTGSDQSQGYILQPTDPLIDADADPLNFLGQPAFKGLAPTATGPIAILSEPIADGAIGYATVLGIALCEVDLTDLAHGYATPTTDPTRLASSITGPARILWHESGSTGVQTCAVLLETGELHWRVIGPTGITDGYTALTDRDMTMYNVDSGGSTWTFNLPFASALPPGPGALIGVHAKSAGITVYPKSATSDTIDGSTAPLSTRAGDTVVLMAIGATSWALVSSTMRVEVVKGGTGLNSIAAHNLLIGNGVGSPNLLPPGTSAYVLTSNGSSADPTWQAATGGSGTVTSVSGSGGSTGLTLAGGPISTTGTLTLGGTLVVGSGGTGLTSITAHNLLIGNGASAPTLLAPGTSGYVLTSNGASADPTWQAAGGGGSGTVTSVDGDGGGTGLTLTGGAITTSGTLTLGGTLAVASGGTGAVTAAAARTNLGLVIGTDVLAFSTLLAAIVANAPVAVTGSRSDGTALNSFLTSLAAIGLVTNSTTA